MSPASPRVLAVDAGTTGVRVSVVDTRGTVRTVRSLPLRPAPELDAEEVWHAVARLARDAVADAGPVDAVGCAAQLAVVVVDAEGQPLRPALTWTDPRGRAEAEALERRVGRETFLRRCGRPVVPELPLAKLAWMAAHEPEVLDRAAGVLSLKDYLVLQLTGEMGTDYVHASYTGLLDVGALAWADDLAETAGIRRDLLPPVRWPSEVVGRVRGRASRAAGLLPGTPVVSGGPDGTVGMGGLGLSGPGEAADTAGTSDVIFAVTDRPATDPEGRVLTNVYLTPGRWAVGGPTTTTGGFLEWVAQVLGGSPPDLARLLEEAASVAPGADGVVVLPDLVGGRTPHWTPCSRGAVCGLRLSHTRAHVVRAVLEAAACVERDVLRRVEEVAGPVGSVRIGGGAARHPLAVQVRADVTGVPHLASPERHVTSLGAAILAAVGSGHAATVEEAVSAMVHGAQVYRPDPCRRDLYRDVYQRYRAVRALMADAWRR